MLRAIVRMSVRGLVLVIQHQAVRFQPGMEHGRDPGHDQNQTENYAEAGHRVHPTITRSLNQAFNRRGRTRQGVASIVGAAGVTLFRSTLSTRWRPMSISAQEPIKLGERFLGEEVSDPKSKMER